MLTFQPDRKQNTTREQKVLVFSRYYHYLYPLLLFMNAFQPIETSFVKTTENGWNLTPKGSPRSPRRRELSPHKSSLSPKSAHGSPKCKLNDDSIINRPRNITARTPRFIRKLWNWTTFGWVQYEFDINADVLLSAVLVSVRDIKMPQHGFAKGPLLSTSQIHHESVSNNLLVKYDSYINRTTW